MTQRPVFFTDADYHLYLRLLRRYSEHFELSVLGYCLMPNHVHLIVVPRDSEGFARAVGAGIARGDPHPGVYGRKQRLF